MSIELSIPTSSVKFTVAQESEIFLQNYIKDRFTLSSLFSYSRKSRVYFYIVDQNHLKFGDYQNFNTVQFRSFTYKDIFAFLFTDPPFVVVSLSNIVSILDSLKLDYSIDSIGIFTAIL